MSGHLYCSRANNNMAEPVATAVRDACMLLLKSIPARHANSCNNNNGHALDQRFAVLHAVDVLMDIPTFTHPQVEKGWYAQLLLQLLPLLVSRCSSTGGSSMNTVKRLFELYGACNEEFDAVKFVELMVDNDNRDDVYKYAHPYDLVFRELKVTNWVVGNEDKVLQAVALASYIPFRHKAQTVLNLVPWLGFSKTPQEVKVAAYRTIFKNPCLLTQSGEVRSTLVAVLRKVSSRACHNACTALVRLDREFGDKIDLTCAIVTLIMCLGEKEKALWKDTNKELLSLLMYREQYYNILLSPSTELKLQRVLVTYAQTALHKTAVINKYGSNACKAAVLDTYVMFATGQPDLSYLMRLITALHFYVPHWLVGSGNTRFRGPFTIKDRDQHEFDIRTATLRELFLRGRVHQLPWARAKKILSNNNLLLSGLVTVPERYTCAITGHRIAVAKPEHRYLVACPRCSCVSGLLAYLKWLQQSRQQMQTCPKCVSHAKRTIIHLTQQTFMDEDSTTL